MSYFAGFLFTDGCIQQEPKGNARIEYASTDKHIVDDITKFLEYNREVTIQLKNNYNKDGVTKRKNCYYNTMYSDNSRFLFDQLGVDVSKKDVKEHHTINNFKFELNFYSFLRGHLDGDGCISVRHTRRKFLTLDCVRFLCREKIANEIFVKLKEDGFCPYKVKIPLVGNCSKQIYHITLYCGDALRLLKKMYSNSTIHLDRKYKQYLKVKNCFDDGINDLYYINNIDNIENNHELISYIKGFVYSSGYIMSKNNGNTSDQIVFESSNKQIIEDLTKLLEYSRDVQTRIMNTNKKQYSNTILSFSARQLFNLGLEVSHEKRTIGYKVNFWHFLRGYLDGCVDIKFNNRIMNKIRIRTSSMHLLLEEMYNQLLFNDIHAKEHKRFCNKQNKSLYSISIYSKDGNKFINNLYQNATIYRKDKYEKIKEYIV